MALFIHPDNQKLLWDAISRTELFNTIFPPSSQSREPWFRNIIEIHYRKFHSIQLNIDNLNELNRQVVTHMITTLREMNVPLREMNTQRAPVLKEPTPEYSRNISTQRYNEPTTEYSRNISTETPLNKQEIYNMQFNERQKEYERMNAKPLPPEINIGETVKDEVIQNMDELIKIHEKQREEELRKYMSIIPPPPQQTVLNPSNGLKILPENIQLVPDDLINEKPKKNVSWSENTQDDGILLLQQQINELRNELEFLRSEMKEMKQATQNTTQ